MIENIFYLILPSLTVGFIAFYSINFYYTTKIKHQEIIQLKKEIQKDTLPKKIKAHERITLYLNRIRPNVLIKRKEIDITNNITFGLSLINIIEKEFEHNVVQQLYIKKTSWDTLLKTKEMLKQKIIESTYKNENQDIATFKKTILTTTHPIQKNINTALNQLKRDIATFT